MFEYESSLRLPVLVMGVALVGLTLAASAHAAGGSPVPVPDDPPPGMAITQKKVAQPVTAPRVTKDDAATPAAQSSVPTPDPPVVATTATRAEPPVEQSAVARREKAATAVPAPVGRAARPRVTARSTVAPVVTPVVTQSRPTAQPARPARSEPLRAQKRPSASAKKPTAPATRAAERPDPVARLPRDALRVGLPVGALIVGRPESEPDAGLLALAGLLLVVAAAGTLVLGIAARGAARHA